MNNEIAVLKAAYTILIYCKNRICTKCVFYNDKGRSLCIFDESIAPSAWDMSSINDKMREKMNDCITCHDKKDAKKLIDVIGGQHIEDWEFLDNGKIKIKLNCSLADIVEEANGNN